MVGAEDLKYFADLQQRPAFKELILSKSGQPKRQVEISRRLLDNTLRAWRNVSDACFTAAWYVCGYTTKEQSVDLQAESRRLDPSGMVSAWGAMEHATIKHAKVPQWQVLLRDGEWAAIPSSIASLALHIYKSPSACIAVLTG